MRSTSFFPSETSHEMEVEPWTQLKAILKLHRSGASQHRIKAFTQEAKSRLKSPL